MNYLWGAVNAISAPYQYYKELAPLNPSTLTGAIDVIVIRRPAPGGGTELACTPFHVRFGKWQVLRPGEKKVNVAINGKPIPFNMKIGDAGEAFFIFETEGDIPDDLITSPLLEATKPGQSNIQTLKTGRFGAREDGPDADVDVEGDMDMGMGGGLGTSDDRRQAESTQEPDFLDLNENGVEPNAEASGSGSEVTQDRDRDEAGSRKGAKGKAQPVLLTRTIGVGKAVIDAASSVEREKRGELKDQVDAARNVTQNLVETEFYGMGKESEQDMRLKISGNDPGDEALPKLKDEDLQTPDIIDNGDIMMDMGGYHSRQHNRSQSHESRHEDYFGQSIPFPSAGTPSTSLPSSPLPTSHVPQPPQPQPQPSTSSPNSSPTRTLRPIPFPTGDLDIRAPSAPPTDTPERWAKRHPSLMIHGMPPPGMQPQDEFSWEWGAFPQRSPMRASFDHLKYKPSRMGVTDMLNEEEEGDLGMPSIAGVVGVAGGLTGEGDEDEDEDEERRFQRSKSLPPELEGEDVSSSISVGSGGGGGQDARKALEEVIPRMEFPSKVRENEQSEDEREPLSEDESDARAGPRSRERERPRDGEGNKKGQRSWTRWWTGSKKDGRTHSVDVRGANAQDDANAPTRKQLAEDRPPLKAFNSVPVVTPQGIPAAESSTPESEEFDPSYGGSARSLPNDPAPIHQFTSTPLQESPPSPVVEPSKRFAKTLRLTSDQLERLNLEPGANTITFSLSSSGVAACTARIFVWDSTDHIVISDIDGTITKSDALGHVFTMIGRDWTHLGVAKLYTDICRNGYKIMYLTSRAIGQADSTRYYLQGIKQNDYQLPEGPVIMSPDRLMASLHREVIMRKPEVFKMACLRDIQRLFGPTSPSPFYAGFGNRITDALSYRSVNVPSSRIFTIDSNGEVKMELLELAGYKSPSVASYIHMTDLVDQMFPPIQHKWESEFTDNNYWKAPVAEFPLPDLSPPSPALSARSDTSNVSTLARLRNFSLRTNSGVASANAAKRMTLPPPVTGEVRGRHLSLEGVGTGVGAGNLDENGKRLRQMSSMERLSSALAGLAVGGGGDRRSVSPESSSGTYLDSEDDDAEKGELFIDGRRRRRRVRTESMPGSLPESRAGTDDEEDLEFGPEEGEEGDEGDMHEEEEVAEQEFDDDLLATGEMQNVPFL